MRERMSSPFVVRGFFIGILAVALLGCPSDIVDIRLGTLEVSAVTTGANLDPDGYQARVTGGQVDATSTLR